MYGELTDKETVARVEYSLDKQQHDQFEILLYKKNSEYTLVPYSVLPNVLTTISDSNLTSNAIKLN